MVKPKRSVPRKAGLRTTAGSDIGARIAEASQSLIGVVDLASGRYTYVNAALVEFLGISRETLLSPEGSSRALSHIHPDDVARVVRARAELMRRLRAEDQDRGFLDQEYRVSNAAGEWRRCHSRITVDLGASDQGGQIIVVGHDVTGQRTAESMQRVLASAVEQTVDHVIVTDRDGRIEFVNPAFERSSGYSFDEVRGQTPALLKSGRHRPAFYKKLWSAITAGKTFRAEFENRKKDGSIYAEEKVIACLRGDQGEITHFVSVGRDITSRKAEQAKQRKLVAAVRKSAAEWTATFDAVETPIAVVTEDGLAVRMNLAMAKVAGRSVQDMIGKPLPRVDAEPWLTIHTALGQAIGAREHVHLGASSDRAGGPDWQVTVSRVVTKAGSDSRTFAVVARDISPIVELQERLRRKETMSALGELLSGVAHEVRNPLFGISATLDAFEEDFSHVGESGTYLRLIRGEVERLTTLMRDLLEFGRGSHAALAPGPLGPVVLGAVRACKPMAEPRVSIDVSIGDDLPPVVMDPSRVAQVLQNLIENAVQHSPAGGRVRVRCELRDRTIACSIEDEGPGIPEADLPRLFQPFFSRRRGGTGLGLSIVQRIVEEHGGEIRLANRPGGGAVATVRFPIATSG